MYCIRRWRLWVSDSSVTVAWFSSSCGRQASHMICWLRSQRTSDLSRPQKYNCSSQAICTYSHGQTQTWRYLKTRNLSTHINLQTHASSVLDIYVTATLDLRVNACWAPAMYCVGLYSAMVDWVWRLSSRGCHQHQLIYWYLSWTTEKCIFHDWLLWHQGQTIQAWKTHHVFAEINTTQ